jgi:CheY-like chemotaxis protein
VPPPKRILLIDDDEAMRRWFPDYLADLGYETHTALDAEHALRSAIALRPDLIILDVYLPEPSFAVRFAGRYRERVSAEHRAPIIAMSASDKLEALAQQIGANDVLQKPFDLSALVKLLGKYLDDPADAQVPEPAIEIPPSDAVGQPEGGTA